MKNYQIKWVDPDGKLDGNSTSCEMPNNSTVLSLKKAVLEEDGLYDADQVRMTFKSSENEEGKFSKSGKSI